MNKPVFTFEQISTPEIGAAVFSGYRVDEDGLSITYYIKINGEVKWFETKLKTVK